MNSHYLYRYSAALTSFPAAFHECLLLSPAPSFGLTLTTYSDQPPPSPLYELIRSPTSPNIPSTMVFSRIFIVLFAVSTILTITSAKKCVPVRTIDANFCRNPPVVKDFDLSAYTGQWFQLFTTGISTRLSSNRCTTANYTLSADGSSVAVLNCELRTNSSRPTCVRATAGPRENATAPAQLGVSFFPGSPPGAYNVAALEGFASYGYSAAAVFSCEVVRLPNGQERIFPSFFIIGRSPYAPRFTLGKIRKELRCMGYFTPYREFIESAHPPECKYQGLPGSFDVVLPRRTPFVR